MKKKVLITGGCGFIGSHLAYYHINQNDEVIVIDSCITGTKDHIFSLLKHEKFQFFEEDLQNSSHLSMAIEWADTIYHMAALLGQKYVLSHPQAVLSENIHTLEKVLLLSSQSLSPKKILVASSSCVYGSSKSTIHDDETTPMEVLSSSYLQETYTTSKIVNEVMSLCYTKFSHLHIVIARFFNIVGPHQTGRYGMVLPTFIQQALNNEPITVYGDGTQTRSFCNVSDAISAMELLLSTPSCKGEVFNIGKEEEISILNLALLVKELTHSSSTIEKISYEIAYGCPFKDIKNRCPNIQKLIRYTGYSPQTSLETTIYDILKYK